MPAMNSPAGKLSGLLVAEPDHSSSCQLALWQSRRPGVGGCSRAELPVAENGAGRRGSHPNFLTACLAAKPQTGLTSHLSLNTVGASLQHTNLWVRFLPRLYQSQARSQYLIFSPGAGQRRCLTRSGEGSEHLYRKSYST